MSRKSCRLRTFSSAFARVAAFALAGTALGAIAPAIGQDRGEQDRGQDRPESILPPGFGDPSPAPTAKRVIPRPTNSAAPSGGLVQPLPAATPSPDATPTAAPTPTVTMVPVDPETLAEYEMPRFARRSPARIGVESEDGMRADAFGNADGRYIERLMRHTSAPLPSRWLSILLRRTLVSRVDTPARINGADFAAERAWLLLRMGESMSARAVVQGVDNADYTPKLYQVAMNASLAASDPSALCPLADAGVATTGERGWTVAQAMCAALTGSVRAPALLTAVRRRRVASGVDLRLAQKVIGAGPRGGQSITIDWAGVDRLTPWRFGLATATGVALPADLMQAVGAQVTMWQALSPAVSLADRLPSAEAAAAQGVLSNVALVDLYGAVDTDDDQSAAAASVARDLGSAYTDKSVDARMAALRRLWGNAAAGTPYARIVLTARAATRIPVASGNVDADRLVAALLSAGLDRAAARWRGAVDGSSDAWAMIALADPDARGTVSYGSVTGYAGTRDAALKRQMLFAGMAGLGRLAPDDVTRGAQALEVRIGTTNAWTQALDRAVKADQPGTVVLLSAIGMQTSDWRGIPPAALYHIVRALSAVGLESEARMIAAEAIARL